MLAKGGFSVKGWILNKDMSKGNGKEKISGVTEVFEGGEVDKVLGVVWDHGTDELCFKVRPDLIKASDVTDQNAADCPNQNGLGKQFQELQKKRRWNITKRRLLVQ